MDNDTTRPSSLGIINTVPSGLGPMSSNRIKRKPETGNPLVRIGVWLAIGAVLVLVVRHLTR